MEDQPFCRHASEETTLTTPFTIEELPIPASLDSPDAVGFIEMVAVRNAVEAETLGSTALEVTAQELLPP